MKIKTKKHHCEEKAAMRRCQVLDAAANCFRRKGYHAASMAEIARESGMSAGHIYNYFESKEQIIQAFVHRDKEELFDILQKLQAMPGPLLEGMIERVDYGIEHNTDLERGALHLEMMAEAARNDKVCAVLQAGDEVARSRMHAMLTGPNGPYSAGECPDLEARIDVMFSLFNGLLIRSLLNPSLNKEAVKAVMQDLIRVLLGEPIAKNATKDLEGKA
ncbi:MAG: TetR/AcrR family transcriptional regulator [Acidobacteria bacterium]|nr:TetR/AcrR family transcriptional regulator [Acidobacteriota bacterium]